MIDKIKSLFHFHRWKTTHTNGWYHPTKQECRCGMTREMERDADFYSANKMPFECVHWLRSDGAVEKWSILD